MHHIAGYTRVAEKNAATRHRILRAHLRTEGNTNAAALHLIRRINVLAIYQKNRNPALSALFRDDMAYAQRIRRELAAKRASTRATNKTPISRPRTPTQSRSKRA